MSTKINVIIIHERIERISAIRYLIRFLKGDAQRTGIEAGGIFDAVSAHNRSTIELLNFKIYYK